MTPKERMAAAMSRSVPDRVPVMCQMSVGHMLLQTGAEPSRFWHAADAFAEGLVKMRSLYGFDGILVSLHGHSAGWERRVAGVEQGPGGERIRWKNGDETFFPFDGLPVVHPARTPVRPDFGRFDPESLPPQVAYIPVSQGLRFPLDPEHLFDVISIVRELAGREFSIHGEVTSPLDYFLDLFGFEQAMIGFLEDPGRAAQVLGRFTTGIVAVAEGLVDEGVDAVKISSPFAGAGFLSAAFYRTFVLPCESRIVRAVEARGARAYLHTCGDVHDRLELMAGSGASGIECLDPPPLGRVDLADAKRRIGGKVFIKGNIDPVHVLLSGPTEFVRADALRRVATGKPGGGYILSTACSIAPRTPRENVIILAEAAEAAGAY
jgi:uroporphyrinogen-III decarboxylase